METHKAAYQEEAFELIGELEGLLMELEGNPDDRELIHRIFRALHTIKGSGAMFGFEDVAGFTHEIESVYEAVRDGRVEVTKTLVDHSLSAIDVIQRMVGEEPVEAVQVAELMGRFKKIYRSIEAEPVPESPAAPENHEGISTLYRIDFSPHTTFFATGSNPILLLKELQDMGECRIQPDLHGIPQLDALDPEECRLRWRIDLLTDRGINAVEDVFIFAADACDLDIRISGDGEIEKRTVEPEKPQPDTEKESAPLQRKESRKENRASIRVPAEKLDTLVDLVGELVTVQANLSRKAGVGADAELVSISESVERLTGSLRDVTMSIRMIPIGTTFQRYQRLVRDLSKELGKEVRMETEGGETELDKTVIEQLGDPLIHIIRNAIDHGIERPDVRERLGKPRQGTIRLSAEHAGTSVLIRISGDGAGIDPEQIRKCAVERNLIPPDMILEEDEIYNLLFLPGFSTAKRLSDVSGRGVGMDVVKRRIEALQGTVHIASSLGKGTAVTLKLPLTLAIIDGLLVQIGDGDYILPLSAVEECVEMDRKSADRSEDRDMMDYRGSRILYINLRRIFHTESLPPPIERVVISRLKGETVGFGLDGVVGQHQTVIKPIGKLYKDIRGISGATILGDGSVALILDLHQILETVEGDRRREKTE